MTHLIGMTGETYAGAIGKKLRPANPINSSKIINNYRN